MRKLLACLTLVTGLLAVPACSSGDGDRLTIYSGRQEALIGPVLEQFSEEEGIGIDVRYDDSANLALLIDTEGDQSPADVFVSQSPGSVDFLDQKDRLLALPADILELVAADERAGDGSWVGLSGRVRVLVYNTETVDADELPDTVFDLTDPVYAGRLGVAPGNGSFLDFVTAMRSDVGDEETLAWLSGLADNDAETYPNNIAIVEAVGRGEIDFGLVNHYYNEQAKVEDPGVVSENHFFPEGDLGGLLLVTAASVVDTTDQRDDAERFVEFLLSTEAQRYFADETREYPLVDGVEPASGLPAFDELPLTRIDFDALGGLERTEELINESGLEG